MYLRCTIAFGSPTLDHCLPVLESRLTTLRTSPAWSKRAGANLTHVAPGDYGLTESFATPVGSQIWGPRAIYKAFTRAMDTIIYSERTSYGDVDLSWMGWNEPARSEKIVAFLRGSRDPRFDIVVHDTGWIERSCPRLTRLLKHYGHLITIRRTGEDARHAMDPLLIVDDQHYLHRLNVAQPRAVLGIAQPDEARPLVERFEAIWSSAEPGLSATVLGL